MLEEREQGQFIDRTNKEVGMKYKIKVPKNLVNIYHCEATLLKNGKTKFIESKNYSWKKFEKKFNKDRKEEQ